MTRPIIAITAWRRLLPTALDPQTDLYTLGGEYADSVQAAGGIPILVPDIAETDVPTLLGRVDGLLLSGGQDVSAGPRETTEGALLAEAQRARLPIFGICRGLQLINVERGGTLIADLPHTQAHPAAAEGEERVSSHHIVEAVSWVAATLPPDRRVNSLHHQAIDRLGDGLAVAARADDGTVEAVHGTVPSQFLRAVQWHPEKLPGADGRTHAVRLLTPFIQAAASHHRQTAITPHKKDHT